MDSAENQPEILAISRIVDQVAEEYLGDEPDWDPLHVVLPLEWCAGFMWMFRAQEGDAVIEMYKHGITRRYLMLDQLNRAYRYTGDGHIRIPVAVAVERVFEGIAEMGLDQGNGVRRRVRRREAPPVARGRPDGDHDGDSG